MGEHGGADKTIHVGVEYAVHGEEAEHNAKAVAGALGHAGKHAHGLTHHLKELRTELNLTAPALFGIGYGLGSWVEKAKEANAEFGRTKRAVASTLSTVLDWEKGATAMDRYKRSVALAGEVTEKLEDTYARFGTSTEELGGVYRTLAISAGPLKMTQAQLLDLTTESAAAAKLYGVSGQDAANRIGTALIMRTVRASDDFGKSLKLAVGNLKGLTQQQVFAKMQRALKDVTALADEASQGMGDSMRRIQHEVEHMLEGLSAPAFREVAKTLGDVAAKMKEIGASGKPVIVEYAEKIKDAFGTMRDLTKLILDHWKEIAAVWAGMKAINLGSKMAEAMGGASAGGAARKVGGMVRDASIPFIGALIGYDIEKGAEYLNTVKGQTDLLGSMKDAVAAQRAGDTPGAVAALKAAGFNSDSFSAIVPKAQALATNWGDEKTRKLAGVGSDELVAALGDLNWTIANSDKDPFGGEKEPENKDEKLKTRGTPPINIDHLEMKWNFEDADPDRVMRRFYDDMNSLSDRRTQSGALHPDLE